LQPFFVFFLYRRDLLLEVLVLRQQLAVLKTRKLKIAEIFACGRKDEG
jgi:hypothetical protein